MYETNFHKASTAQDAAALLAKSDDGKILAGGQTLIPTMKQRLAAPADLVDLSRAEALRGVTITKRKKMGIMKADGGETITIGAMTTHAEVAGNTELAQVCPVICGLAGNIGDPAVRHRGTIGGSVANNDPAADYPAALLALGATIHTNSRDVAAEDYFKGMFLTALDDMEIITAVSFQAPVVGGYGKFPNPASRYAMVGVFVAKSVDGEVRVSVTGAGDNGVYRHAGLEAALSADWSASAVDAVDVSTGGLMSDLHGTAAYRANLIKVMAKRALA
ncbi:MAG: FAD binding domain-containing protein [Rhodobacterales bacterium]|jgi:carbon-monoxide dehydrogenase medium subunit|uniref:FAD binding domain-containing protein n=1 Tax=uncultured Planktomarina sp. TaxID=1538529 RepID=UPI00326138EC|tara:strand:- start:188 stop:1015 length:828 start_codon:yes stop_codon:yes gene_type:complete